MSLSLRFRHAYPGRTFDIVLAADTPGTLALFGPSGAGKSTVAAVLAGLLRPDEGRLEIDGEVLADSARGLFVPPERRRVGVVFQQSRLFPHMSVRANLRYGLRRAQVAPSVFTETEIIELLGLTALLDRRPATLSGGEAQRVAIGRALLAQPRLLIMDEPLASLDHARRREILPFIAGLRARLRLPILYITHALEEAARLADTLALIEDGRIEATGNLVDMLGRADLPLARRDDAGAILECLIAAHEQERGLTRLTIVGAEERVLLMPACTGDVGQALRVKVAAADVILAAEVPRGISVQNKLAARVERLVPSDTSCLVELRMGSARLLARITAEAARSMGLVAGSEVLALVKSVAVQRL